MTIPTAIFFDVGGVLGTNGWDHISRKRAAEKYKLDWNSFEALHDIYAEALDTGKISLEDYVSRVALAEPREFSQGDFISFMKSESKADVDAIALAADLAASRQYYVATLNNESPELNDYRIEKFGLAKIFSAFFSSGYLGVRKPQSRIYEIALQVSHKKAQECVFVDDREENLVQPKSMGFTGIQFVSATQARQEFEKLGILSV